MFVFLNPLSSFCTFCICMPHSSAPHGPEHAFPVASFSWGMPKYDAEVHRALTPRGYQCSIPLADFFHYPIVLHVPHTTNTTPGMRAARTRAHSVHRPEPLLQVARQVEDKVTHRPLRTVGGLSQVMPRSVACARA